jgi:hypothetical protein
MDIKRGFKKKTIEQTIKNKVEHWIASITDEKLQERVKDHYILTGGAIASMLLGDLPNDYDVYLDDADVAADLCKYYIEQLTGKPVKSGEDNELGVSVQISEKRDRVKVRIPSAGVLNRENEIDETENTGKYKVLMITANAITLSHSIQIVLRFVGNAEEIHKNYDFVHATNYYTTKTGLVLHQAALESLMSRELKYVGSLYPVCSVFRIKKFINRGWTITAGETLKILFDVSNLDLKNIDVLEDQLTGVDTSYFTHMIALMRAKESTQFDRTYLFDLINQVFDGREDEYTDTSNEEDEEE